MAALTVPKYVRQVLITLQSRGYPAYLVGGCVRDMLLGVRPNDWDVCTGALPEEVMEVFPSSRPTGLKHGTVTVACGRRSVEVTTFRSEGGYADHRHPDSVSFVRDLNTDLSRRDFTMNAMALPPDGLLADPFGGREDIAARLIRCVGEPERRFEEDALRMLRAVRFAARLDFEIESGTLAAIEKKAYLASSLAAERVRDEAEKILLTKKPEYIYTLISLGLMDAFIKKRPDGPGKLPAIARLPKKALDRWAALCIILTAQGCIGSAEEFLTSLRLDSRTVRCCADAAALISGTRPSDSLGWKRLLNAYGVDSVSSAALCRDALFEGHAYRELRAVLKSGECFSLRHLAVSGDDLLALGIQGKELGDTLRFLLDYVMEYPGNNRRELLLSLVSRGEE